MRTTPLLALALLIAAPVAAALPQLPPPPPLPPLPRLGSETVYVPCPVEGLDASGIEPPVGPSWGYWFDTRTDMICIDRSYTIPYPYLCAAPRARLAEIVAAAVLA